MEGTHSSAFGNALLLSFVLGYLVAFNTVSLGYACKAFSDLGNKEG